MLLTIDNDNDNQSSNKFIWRTINGIGCVFFLFAAFVNLNDHDWYLWVTIYICTSMFLAIEVFNYRSLPNVIICVNALVFCLFIAYGCHLLFKYQYENNVDVVKNHFLQHEEGRELSGLALASSWLFLILLNRLLRFNYRLSFVIVSCGLFLVLVPVGMWSVCFVSNDWRQRFPQCHTMIVSEQHSHFHPTF
ncbi:unnamed protein product [Adineta steineri]|uniref:Uncharacterized protein n=1 Tax=Adineta steineri TaxID=433720 RepID=A0A813NFZ1_9BILA|nr:unnamed protein product [Adineta steineri]CAF1247244.1 unnamed protein product [Adineta steineri]CAF1275979.1 unnamed protein product [Adineta steineri]